jgi:hypothetical protein
LGEFLNPSTVRRRFFEIGNDLEKVIRDAHEELSRVEEKIVEDIDASAYLAGKTVTKEAYEDILTKLFNSILEAEDYREGRFCHATCPNWEHIQTAYVLHIFDQLELPLGSWYVHDERRSVQNMIAALIHEQLPDGTWGEDFYDTCYTLSALLVLHNTHSSLPGYQKAVLRAVTSILQEIKAGFAASLNKEWYGAGFYGAALALFGRHGEQLCQQRTGNLRSDEVRHIIQELLRGAMKFYEENGTSVRFKADLTSNPTTPDEWHTAEMLIGLYYCRGWIAPDPTMVSGGIQWLESQRGDRPLWCNEMGSRLAFINTGRVLHALALVDPQRCGEAIA